jgi:hypothetical protein
LVDNATLLEAVSSILWAHADGQAMRSCSTVTFRSMLLKGEVIMDDQLLREARANLDEYCAGLPPEKDGAEFVKRLCWHIERHHNETRRALEMAVGTPLKSSETR